MNPTDRHGRDASTSLESVVEAIFADAQGPVTHLGYANPPEAFCGADVEEPDDESPTAVGSGGGKRCPVCAALWNVFDNSGYVERFPEL